MTCFRSSRTDQWCEPRAHRDPAMRHRIYGPLRGMDDSRRFEPPLWFSLGVIVFSIGLVVLS